MKLNKRNHPRGNVTCLTMMLFVAFTTIKAVADPPYSTDYWVCSTNVSGGGTGTLANPFDGSTEAKFDGIMNALPTRCSIHLLTGTYQTYGIQTNAWAIKTGQRIVGSGIDKTVIHLNNIGGGNQIGNTVFGGTNIEVSDVTIDMAGTVNYSGLALFADHSAIRRVKVTNLSNSSTTEIFPLIIQCWDPNITGYSFHSEANIIEDCQINVSETGYYSVIAMTGGPTNPIAGIIRNNHIVATKLNSPHNGFGINVYNTHDTIVDGNYVAGVDFSVYSDSGSNTNLIIANNSFQNVFTGVLFANYPSTNVLVTGNTIGLMPAPVGSGVAGVDMSPVFVGSPNHRNITVTGNKIVSCGPIGAGVSYASRSEYCNGFVFVNNRVDTNFIAFSVSSSGASWYGNVDLDGVPWIYNQDPAHGVFRTTIAGSTYTLVDSDRWVGIQNAGGAMTVTVPDAHGRAGKEWTIVREDNTGNSFSITRSGTTYKILGSTTYPISIAKNAVAASITLVSDGANWWGKP